MFRNIIPKQDNKWIFDGLFVIFHWEADRARDRCTVPPTLER